VQEQIVANIRKGVHINVAARAAGIGSATFYRWMEAGLDKVAEDGSTIVAAEPYRSFRAAVEDAEAHLELELVDRYRTVSEQAAFGNASHLAGFLGRRFRQRWDVKSSLEVSGPGGAPIEVKGGADDLEAFLAALARAGLVTLPGGQGDVPAPSREADEPLHPA
jgi:hypothetical protein